MSYAKLFGIFVSSIILGVISFISESPFWGVFFITIGLLSLIFIVLAFIEELGIVDKIDEVFKTPINKGEKCQYPVIWEMGMVYQKNEKGSQLISKLLHDGIQNNLLYGADDFFRDEPYSKNIFISYTYELIKSKLIKIVTDETMQKVDDLAKKNKIENYFFADISRSSRSDISTGTYICSFDESDNLSLLRAPFTSYSLPNNQVAAIYDRRLHLPIVKISKISIKDFQTFGSQLMQSTVESGSVQEKIGLLSTGLSEIVFGTAYTMLKGMSKASITTKHDVKDVRVVQVVFNDKTDIELKGISIFFEFNRRMGNIKNKESEDKNSNLQMIDANTSLQAPSVSSYIQELKDLKELLESGIITEQEFVEKKSFILTKK